MSKVTRQVWHCDVCGWEWLPDSSKVPERCPNRKCRKRNWNDPPIGREAMTALMDDAKKFIATAKHLSNCPCLMCNPPK